MSLPSLASGMCLPWGYFQRQAKTKHWIGSICIIERELHRRRLCLGRVGTGLPPVASDGSAKLLTGAGNQLGWHDTH
ncbi:MAG: hypothetical protein ACK43N_25375, partial [Pirellulaceae bacterium]